MAQLPTIGDCFIGDFPVTQVFGANPQNYQQFGLAGHDGIDFGCPSGTQIISSTDGKVIKVAFDPGGYGNYVEVWDDKQLCATLYAHLDHATVAVGDRVVRGQLIGISDNTGNSTGAHLHFGFCLTDANGTRLSQTNGYFGWLDPDKNATWQITNPTAPVTQAPVDLQATLDQLRLARDTNWNLYQAEVQKNQDLAKQVGDLTDANTKLTEETRNAKTEVSTVHDEMAKMAREDSAAIQAGLDAQGQLNVYVEQLNAICNALGCPKEATSVQDRFQYILSSYYNLQKSNDQVVKSHQTLFELAFEQGLILARRFKPTNSFLDIFKKLFTGR